MNGKLQGFITGLLTTTLLSFSAVSYADDTEIYFAQVNVGNTENKPVANVLFLLDSSGSMSGKKMTDLKNAFNSVVSGLGEDISVGVGRFNGSSGGYVFYPVTPMDSSAIADVKGAVSGLPASGNTPTLESYTEMVRYMLGEAPSDYAKSGQALQSNPRPAVNMQQECNSNGKNCKWVSSSSYDSPINYNNQCESNHVIVMTDGEPVSDYDNASRDYARGKAGSNCNSSYNCQKDLAKWLYNDGEDVLGSGGKVTRKPIKTWQVGFQMTSGNLKNMGEVASAGGTEKVYDAQTAEALAAAFIDILDLIDGQSRSISAPGVAVNTLNRFQHLDELYYAVFQPAESSFWEGNLKRYQLKNQEIHDRSGPAIDSSTGYFKSDASSFWGTVEDGADATKGGAREQVGTRNLYYSSADGGTTSKLSWNAANNTSTVPDNSSFVGLDSLDERKAMFEALKSQWGDPMHSVPLMINYGEDDNYVFVSTNGGMLHIIDTKSGEEVAAFMPHELFEKAPEFTIKKKPLTQDNRRQTYGLGGSWVAWRQAGDSLTDKPAKVYVYGGMRSGGRNYYALDVTNPEAPKLKWQIIGGEGDFKDMGETWSTPTLTRVRVSGEDKPVPALVFGGGYSPLQHTSIENGIASATHNRADDGDTWGNTIYIVNAETGELIWKAAHNDLKWAVPGGVSVVDIDFDGVADHLYFGDLGGQLFRVDMGGTTANYEVHRIASLGGEGVNHRRFYEAPAVAYVKSGAQNHLYVAAASGYRTHPLDEGTNEGLFVVIDKDARHSGTSPVATLSNMANVVDGDLKSDDRGWYYLFEEDAVRPGEKALASPVIFDNTIMLSTYAPTEDQENDNVCAVRYGAAYFHSVDLRTGAPKSISKEGPTPTSRSEMLSQSTPPPTPTLLVDEKGDLIVVVGTEVIGEGDLGNPNLRKRRWMQLPKDEANEIRNEAKGSGDEGGNG
ncbi:PilC/PilY family type IV pilus protein [Halopseudomonas xiamenensis]|uniref:PilC/PilY family type IV pilus protein n=1 Tax=Halopseudomonas xiamenensis TaxID=157792 RepID=UPI001628FD2D|nr:PilC/PilY family type IV pilus protein [Halopseudomonas xiamenensis]